jgi:hypothetical protein
LALLPHQDRVQVVVLLGRATEEERAAIASHFGVECVHDELPSCLIDVLAVRDGTRIRSGLNLLSPRGVAWIEEPSRWSRVIGSSSHAARVCGHQTVAQYWVLPVLDRARRYVATQPTATIRWYLRTVFAPRTPVQEVGRTFLLAFPRLAPMLLGGRATVIAGVSAHANLLVGESEAGLRASQPVVAMSGGHDTGNRMVVIPFDSSGKPSGSVLKVAGHPAMNDLVEDEQAVLQQLHAQLPTALADRTPTPQGIWTWAGRSVSQESLFTGPTLDRAIASGNIDPLAGLELVSAWVERFHSATAVRDSWSQARFEQVIRPTLEGFVDAHGDDAAVAELFRLAEARSAALHGTSLVEVRRHWDLTPSNVILGVDGVAVIDWEPGLDRPADGRGLPVCDLDYFVKFWMHLAAGARSADDEAVLFPHLDSRFSPSAASALEKYCRALDIDNGFVPLLTVYQWAEQAVHDEARARRLGGLPDSRRAARRHLEAFARDPATLFAFW